MSDRRPEKPELFVEYKSRDAGNIERKRYRHASTAHVLAYVRRGVESGTIKGEVGRVEGASVMSQEHTELLVWVSRDVAREIVRGGVDVLVIPVSDGGSET